MAEDTHIRSTVISVAVYVVLFIFIAFEYQQIGELQSTILDLRRRDSELITQVRSLTTEVNNLKEINSQLSVKVDILQNELDKAQAFSILRKTLSSPEDLIASQMVNSAYSIIQDSNNPQLSAIKTLSEPVLKNLLGTFLRTKIPTLVWIEGEISPKGNRVYTTTMATSIPVEIETGIPVIGKVNIGKFVLSIRADVDLSFKTVSNIRIENPSFQI